MIKAFHFWESLKEYRVENSKDIRVGLQIPPSHYLNFRASEEILSLEREFAHSKPFLTIQRGHYH